MARLPRASADGPRHGEPSVAAVLRQWVGEDQRGLRRAGREAVASRTARLACPRISGWRLEREGDAPPDRHVGGLSAIIEGDAGIDRARPGQPPARPRVAL